MDQLLYTFSTLQLTFGILFSYWWIWLPAILLFAWWESFVYYNQRVYLAGLKWITFEIRIPQDAHKSLKAMEQVFSALHVIGAQFPVKGLWASYKKWRGQKFEGKVPDWLSLEIVGMNGEIHFYIRALEKYKSLIESEIYAHYPDSELTLVPDYLSTLPTELSFDVTSLNGLELGLIKDNIFPIKTYPEFEEQGAGKDDLRRIDPLAPIAESLSELQFSEFFGIQILIRNSGDGWIKKGQAEMDKLFGKEAKPKTNVFDKFFASLDAGVRSLGGAETAPVKEEKKKEDKPFNQLNPGVQEIIKAIEHATSKFAFETGIRMIHIAPTETYNASRMGTISGAFKQFSAQALNGFKPVFMTDVATGFNKPARSLYNKKKLYWRFRHRAFPNKPFVLNTEELTTIYHFPDVGVKTPALPRVDSKKGEAPAGLPTV